MPARSSIPATEYTLQKILDVFTNGAEEDPLSLVAFTDKSFVTCDEEEYYRDQGRQYVVTLFSDRIRSNESIDISIVTASKFPHVHISVCFEGYALMQIFEGAQLSGGTQLLPINKNRASTNTASTSFYSMPTITNVGTQIYSSFVPKSLNMRSPWMLKQNMTYLIRVTNKEVSNCMGSVLIEYHSHMTGG